MGLCEPHGNVAAYGLDTIKADWLCDEGARRFGGVVAPTQGWHIHETGYHARWLEEVIGEGEAELGSLPPDVVLRTFLYQLRALANAGFRGVIAVSGHAGGNQIDLRRLAASFMAKVALTVEVVADPELVAEQYDGDHAGRFEISQLLALRPDLVDLSRLGREPEIGRFALGDDASEATVEYGQAILEAQLFSLGQIVKRINSLRLPGTGAWSAFHWPKRCGLPSFPKRPRLLRRIPSQAKFQCRLSPDGRRANIGPKHHRESDTVGLGHIGSQSESVGTPRPSRGSFHFPISKAN